MTSEEVAEFEANEFFREAVRLRYWDDAAKVMGLEVPAAGHYRKRIEAEVGEGSPQASPGGVAG